MNKKHNYRPNLLAMTPVLAVILAISACSTGNPAATEKKDMRTVCLDGVTYYLFSEEAGYKGWGYMSVKLGRDSKIVLCDY